ncbi:peptide-methionine (R)-S-oxide reductase [Methylorubrum extorquens]|uniref:peptide-methionine (R)-S-oxide reductase MsrB n=1 Tax=Methylorubrum extorquens TaxID=408 RepID=UPI000972C55E|nr:peptide-methionine (R)-S-oxide reductase MsrB [Methylorubrum extorquens]APX87604.1 peptide-methionine (R)-S-oxide reductase [Methylorubrum extorquens]
MNRRQTLRAGASLLGLLAASRLTSVMAGPASAAGFEVEKSEAEWRARLSPAAYQVLREHGTERAYTSPLNGEKRPGRFVCAGCDLPLFSSKTKFESGTGWPSFFETLPSAVGTQVDSAYGMRRTEVHCRRCGGHLGHVFEDGPKPTGLRYCMNGVSLRFEPAADGPA